MGQKYIYIVDLGLWRCKKCGKMVKEFGWFGHNRYHKNKEDKTSTQLEL